MDDTRPEAVLKAVDLLKRAEAVLNHEGRAREIVEAFISLLQAEVSLVYETPVSPHLAEIREYIQNCKRAYLRSHMRLLSLSSEPDWDAQSWNGALFSGFKEVMDEVLQQCPDLRSWYERRQRLAK